MFRTHIHEWYVSLATVIQSKTRHVNIMFCCVILNVFRMFHDCYVSFKQHFDIKLQILYLQT